MISDETRQIAEEAFDYIERSEASGNSYEARQPAVTPESCGTPYHKNGYRNICRRPVDHVGAHSLNPGQPTV